MKEVVLKRFYVAKNVDIKNQNEGTLGVLFIDKELFCFTLEPPWRNNGVDSCIPVGSYVCKRFSSEKHPNTFEIRGVKGRSSILIHSGNTDVDSLGCILLGSVIDITSKKMVLNSKDTFRKFMDKMKDVNEFILKIYEV